MSGGEHLTKPRAALDWLLAQHPVGIVEIELYHRHDPLGWPSVRGSMIYRTRFVVPVEDDDYDWPVEHYAVSRSGGVYRIEFVDTDRFDRPIWRVTDPEPVWRASWSPRRQQEAVV